MIDVNNARSLVSDSLLSLNLNVWESCIDVGSFIWFEEDYLSTSLGVVGEWRYIFSQGYSRPFLEGRGFVEGLNVVLHVAVMADKRLCFAFQLLND